MNLNLATIVKTMEKENWLWLWQPSSLTNIYWLLLEVSWVESFRSEVYILRPHKHGWNMEQPTRWANGHVWVSVCWGKSFGLCWSLLLGSHQLWLFFDDGGNSRMHEGELGTENVPSSFIVASHVWQKEQLLLPCFWCITPELKLWHFKEYFPFL